MTRQKTIGEWAEKAAAVAADNLYENADADIRFFLLENLPDELHKDFYHDIRALAAKLFEGKMKGAFNHED